jgi:hypothetical protein
MLQRFTKSVVPWNLMKTPSPEHLDIILSLVAVRLRKFTGDKIIA